MSKKDKLAKLHKERDPFFTEMVKRKSGRHKDKRRAYKELRDQKHKTDLMEEGASR